MDIYGHIMDKVQKLTGALYRVTELLSDKEPLKWILRNRAINIYDNLMDICPLDNGHISNGQSNGHLKDKGEKLNETLNLISHIIHSLDLALISTAYISNINFDILKKEYKNLKDFIEGKKSAIIPEQKLLPEFTDKKHIFIPAGPSGNKPLAGKITETASSNSYERKEKILNFLKGEGPKTINEIRLIFKEISGKSVQRDLSDLVKFGKIKAEGEKRWRKYFYVGRF